MARSQGPMRRPRGTIDKLPSGALRVRVYAGTDPVTKKRLDLTEIIPPGESASREAEKVRTRFLNQVDEKRNPRTRATLGQLVKRWLELHDGARSTVSGYESKARNHIYPLIGDVPLARVDAEVLDSFYTELRRCRDHCDGTRHLRHRTQADHQCDEHVGVPCEPIDVAGCRACRRKCKPHTCRGLGNSTIRQVHWIISGALDRGIAWRWLSVNPAEHASKPGLPHPEPSPPVADDAARLVEHAWQADPDWGAFVWTKMTLGARRSEMCALRWRDVDLAGGTITIRRSFDIADGELVEKDTKAHQQRRVVLDSETTQILSDLRQRAEERASEFGIVFRPNGYVFSPDPGGIKPLLPDTATQRYKRLANRLGIDTTLKNLRHYSATELINAGVNIRTVAGRLGHGGGGATTLRVYTAWSSEADQRASTTLTGRMPKRPGAADMVDRLASANSGPVQEDDARPYMQIANDLQAAIRAGILSAGDRLPSEKALARKYEVARSTAHRAIRRLVDEKIAEVRTGSGTYVLPQN